MRAAPAVSLAVATAPAWVWALRGLLAATARVVLFWARPRGDAVGVAGFVWAAAYALWLAWRTRRPRQWQLSWDGQDWWLAPGAGDPASASGQRGQMAVAFDLGSALLLRFSPGEAPSGGGVAGRWRRPIWLPLHRDALPVHWHALRCALYSPPPRMRDGEA
jgi:hypothetical protein